MRVVAVVLFVDHKDLRGRIQLRVHASVSGEILSSPSWEHKEPEHEAEQECSENTREVAFVLYIKCKTGENKTNLMI